MISFLMGDKASLLSHSLTGSSIIFIMVALNIKTRYVILRTRDEVTEIPVDVFFYMHLFYNLWVFGKCNVLCLRNQTLTV